MALLKVQFVAKIFTPEQNASQTYPQRKRPGLFAVSLPTIEFTPQKNWSLTISRFDLPPTEIAEPLPVPSSSRKRNAQPPPSVTTDGKARKRKRRVQEKDDTPRAFKRLIAFAQGRKFRSGLDDGVGSSKTGQKRSETTAMNDEATDTPKVSAIRPGERLGDYAARVDAALPLGGLINKAGGNSKDPLGLKPQKTRKEKKMHKLYNQWREEERRIQERKEEEQDLAENQALEDGDLGFEWGSGPRGMAKGRKKRRKGTQRDEWEELRQKRAEAKIGLNDVAKAPPVLHRGSLVDAKVVRGARIEVGNVPKTAGSLRRREELAKVRDQVVSSYRSLVDERRPALR